MYIRITWSGVAFGAACGARDCLFSAGGPGALVCVCRCLRDELPALDVTVLVEELDAFFFARGFSARATGGCTAREAAALVVASEDAA